MSYEGYAEHLEAQKEFIRRKDMNPLTNQTEGISSGALYNEPTIRTRVMQRIVKLEEDLKTQRQLLELLNKNPAFEDFLDVLRKAGL